MHSKGCLISQAYLNCVYEGAEYKAMLAASGPQFLREPLESNSDFDDAHLATSSPLAFNLRRSI